MKFDNVVIIEKTGDIPLTLNTIFCGPMRIGEIEQFESKLIRRNIPYVLAQIETIMPRQTIKGRSMMHKKGYCLFIKEEGRNR